MTAVHEDQLLASEFEPIARAVERETEGLRVELIGGRLGVKAVPDGDHNRILNWLLLMLMPLSPRLFLHIAGQGLVVGAYRKGRARPDGVLAPMDAFVGYGEWAPADAVAMTIEVTSHDSDTNRRDRVEKPAAYAQSGIPIYLLIDRDAAEVVVHSRPDGGRYQDVHSYAIGLEITLPEPVGASFDSGPLKDWVG
ncbi:Uma2 family endonuclease [Nocardia panacis]|uniref:Uma2 family endonuclease n=1 Tax=Nocardia panacis TaxID=2340916 RepID=A0A3A4K1B6_9NOCA|nr:Uma2 family endonuclease [Nocardia panacis]RJO69887.1 Uma2 family endonuclease [Nocardia panacis]